MRLCHYGPCFSRGTTVAKRLDPYLETLTLQFFGPPRIPSSHQIYCVLSSSGIQTDSLLSNRIQRLCSTGTAYMCRNCSVGKFKEIWLPHRHESMVPVVRELLSTRTLHPTMRRWRKTEGGRDHDVGYSHCRNLCRRHLRYSTGVVAGVMNSARSVDKGDRCSLLASSLRRTRRIVPEARVLRGTTGHDERILCLVPRHTLVRAIPLG